MILCEVCHKEEATGTIWLYADESPIGVAGVYRVGPKHGGPEKKYVPFYGGETTKGAR